MKSPDLRLLMITKRIKDVSVEFTIDEHNIIANKTIMDANIPEDILVVMIKRNGDVFVPNGSTEILPGDILVLSGNKLKHFNEY